MGRQAKFTESQAFEVMDRLNADPARRVTVSAVREELGGGSTTTILKYVRAWRAAKKGRTITDAVLDHGLSTTIMQSVEVIWQDLVSALLLEENCMREETRSVNRELKTLRQANDTLRKRNALLTEELAAIRRRR